MVEAVDRLPTADTGRHEPVHLGGRGGWRERRCRDDPHASGLGGPVALVRHADDIVAEAEGVCDLGGRRKE